MATYKHLRSSTANKRPTTAIADGQLALNTNTASPGLFFKDSAGTGIVKIGPVHVGTTAPNSTPAAGGSSGNYTGEQWLDTSVSPAQLKVWNGSAWVAIVADELPVSKLQDGAAGQIVQTDSAGTGVEWSSTANLPLGTASAPAYRFQGDTNTGIYSPGADQVAISTNGTGRLFIASNGNVGVGVASASQALEVLGNIAFSANTGSSRTLGPALGSDTTLVLRAGSTTGEGANIELGRDEIVYVDAAQHIFRSTNGGSERMRITSDGKLGLGTSSPGTNLEIKKDTASTFFDTTIDTTILLSGTPGAGNGNFGGSIGFSRLDSASRINAAIAIKQTTADSDQCGLSFFTHPSTATGSNLIEQLSITHDGKVGIGTTSPTDRLEIAGSVRIEDQAASPAIYLRDTDAAGDVTITQRNSGDLAITNGATTRSTIFEVGGGEAARFDSSKRLLVGTSSARTGVFYNGDANTVPRIQVEAAGTTGGASAGAAVGITRVSDVAGAQSYLLLARARGTALGSVSVVSSGDSIGGLTFQAADGTDFVEAASIIAQVDGTPGANDMPGRLVFSVTADGASSPTEAMRIKNTRVINFSNAPVYADNAAAKTGGLVDGDVYRTSTGDLKIVYT